MTEISEPDRSDLARIQLFIDRRNYEAARIALKSLLAGNPTDQGAIDLLMQVEREDFEQRQAANAQQHKSSVLDLSPAFIAASEPWQFVLAGFIALTSIVIKISAWLGREKQKPQAP